MTFRPAQAARSSFGRRLGPLAMMTEPKAKRPLALEILHKYPVGIPLSIEMDASNMGCSKRI